MATMRGAPRLLQNASKGSYLQTVLKILIDNSGPLCCTLNLLFKKYQDSPGLQAEDDEAELLPSPLRRLVDGGKGRGIRVFFFIPGLKAGAIQDRAKFFKPGVESTGLCVSIIIT